MSGRKERLLKFKMNKELILISRLYDSVCSPNLLQIIRKHLNKTQDFTSLMKSKTLYLYKSFCFILCQFGLKII